MGKLVASSLKEQHRNLDVKKVLQAEIGSLRQTLTQADRAAQERSVAAEALQTEVVLLRETLAKAQREAQERAAAVPALQAEIGALQETLTAARQVGKAAIAAFRMDAVAPARPEEPHGWRRAVMRFVGTWTSSRSLN